MHNSLNLLAQRISKISVRSSLHTDKPISADEASSKPLPPLPTEIPRSRAGRPIISLPVPGSFVDLCKSEGPSGDPPPNHTPRRTKRKKSEMPLSCHPPFQQSWIEVQPLRTYTVKPRIDIKSNSTNALGLPDNGYTELPRATSSRPYHGIVLPPPPSPPSMSFARISKRNDRLRSKSPVAKLQVTASANILEQPIAPLTPRRYEDTTSCTAELDVTRAGCIPERVKSSPDSGPDPIPLPTALRDRWANRKSSHVILADTSLQLKVFSELGVELDEVLSMYASGRRPRSGH